MLKLHHFRFSFAKILTKTFQDPYQFFLGISDTLWPATLLENIASFPTSGTKDTSLHSDNKVVLCTTKKFFTHKQLLRSISLKK